MDHWVEAADWIVWQLCGEYVRNACSAGYKGIWQDARVSVAGLRRGAQSRLRRLRQVEARPSHRRAGRARRRSHGAGGALDRAARRHRGCGRQRRRPRHRTRGSGRRGRADAGHHGDVDLSRDEPRPARRGARDVRRRRRRHPRRLVRLRGGAVRGRRHLRLVRRHPGAGALLPGRSTPPASRSTTTSPRWRSPNHRVRTG